MVLIACRSNTEHFYTQAQQMNSFHMTFCYEALRKYQLQIPTSY